MTIPWWGDEGIDVLALIETNRALALGIAAGGLLLVLLTVIALGVMFRANGFGRWRAWVPFVNVDTMLRISGTSRRWQLWLLVPGLGAIVLGIVLFVAMRRIDRKRDGSAWLMALAIGFFPAWAVVGAFAWRKFVKRTERARLIADREREAEEAEALRIALTPVFAQIGPPPNYDATSVRGIPTRRPTASTVRTGQYDEVSELTYTASAPVLPGSGSANSPWELVAGAHRYTITSAIVLLGRAPTPRDDSPGAQLIALHDDTSTLSKAHARLHFDGALWLITDIGSKNGVRLPDGRVLVPWQPLPIVNMARLGDLVIDIRRTAFDMPRAGGQ